METRFPTTVGSNGTRYIFFKSLLDWKGNKKTSAVARKTAWMGRDYLTKQTTKGDSNFSEIEARIQTILVGLKAIADAEYAKEKAYINAQKSKLDSSIFNINFPSTPEGEWSEFITLLNFARGNSDTFFRDVEREYQRVLDNQNYMKEIDQKIKKEGASPERAKILRQGYERTRQYKASEYLTPLVKQMFGTGRSNKNSYANVIKDYIVKQNFNKFISDANGRLNFDSQTFNALVFASVQIIIEELVKNTELKMSDIFGEKRNYESMMSSFSSWIEQEENQKLAGLTKLKGVLDSPFAKQMIATSFKQKMKMSEVGYTDEQFNKRKNSSKTTQAKNLIKDLKIEDTKNKDILKTIAGGQWLKIDSSLYQPSGNWLYTEMSELIPIQNGQIGVALGSPSVKTDNLFISVNLDFDEDLFIRMEQEAQKAYADKYSTLLNNSELLKEDDVSTKNWMERQRKLLEYKNYLTRILSEEKNIKDLSNSFIIESSDKIYESFGAKAKTFDGGSLGPNLASQLAKIDELAMTGGMSLGDIEWLTSAIINSHNSTVIGTGMRQSLEDYLSIIASALLFDDGIQIMQQATQNINQAVSSSSINTIHLFFLQGFGYYPFSQILYHLYRELTKASTEGMIEAKGGSTKVKISLKSYPPDLTPYEDLTISDWEETGAAAENGALLNLTFLGKFLDVLEGLAKPGI